MIAITNDAGLTLNLTAGQNLVTEQAVAWLSDDELPGEFSYPIDAPLNENNRRFVSQGYRPDSALPITELPVTATLNGVLYRRCTFSFRLNAGKLSGFLKIDSSEFYDKIRKLTLLEALNVPVGLGDGAQSNPPIAAQPRLKQIAGFAPGQFPFTFFPIRNEAMLEESFDDSKLAGFVRKAYVNSWEKLADGSFGFKSDLLCPQFYLSYVLEQIITRLAGYRIESDWLASEEIQALTIMNLTAMRTTPRDLGEIFGGMYLVPGLFLPDMSVSDFLKAIKARFGLVFQYRANERVCRITQFRRSVAAGPAIDLTEFQSGDYSTNERGNKGYTVSDFIDEGDELYKDAQGKTISLPTQVTGKGEQAVTLKVGTCQLSYEKSPLSENASWFVPTLRQAGNVLEPKFKLSDRYLNQDGNRPNGIGLKLLSYRGMSQDSVGNAYPLATPDVRDGRQVIVGTDSLTLGGRNGAWRRYLRAYYYFRDQTQLISQPLLLPVSILSALRLDRTVQLSLEDHIRRSYLISKLQAEAPGIDGKAIVRLEVLSLPSGIEQAGDVDDPLVWVELIQVSAGTGSYENRDKGTNGGYAANSLTVKMWADANRSQPAIVTNLPVAVRVKRTYRTIAGTVYGPPPTPYLEFLNTYLANGATTLVEPKFLIDQYLLTNTTADNYAQTASLDPGEGYTILK